MEGHVERGETVPEGSRAIVDDEGRAGLPVFIVGERCWDLGKILE